MDTNNLPTRQDRDICKKKAESLINNLGGYDNAIAFVKKQISSTDKMNLTYWNQVGFELNVLKQ